MSDISRLADEILSDVRYGAEDSDWLDEERRDITKAIRLVVSHAESGSSKSFSKAGDSVDYLDACIDSLESMIDDGDGLDDLYSDLADSIKHLIDLCLEHVGLK